MSGDKCDKGCTGCEISRGGHGVSEWGGIIELDGGWILNHYGAEGGFLGYLALQPKEHRKDFADLLTSEAMALGGNIRDVHVALHDYWSEHYPEDPIERVYVLYFSEYSKHLHIHIVPRTQRLKEMTLDTKAWSGDMEIENRSWQCEAWKIYLATKCDGFPSEYITSSRQNRKEVVNLMEYLRRRLGVADARG